MKIRYLRSEKGWMSLIGMLLAIVIISFWVMTYLQPSQQPKGLEDIDEATGGATADVKIDTSSHLSVLQSTKTSIGAIEARNKNRGDELMKEIEAMHQQY